MVQAFQCPTLLKIKKPTRNQVVKSQDVVSRVAKIGVIFSLATGAAIALAIDVLNTHDLKLARKLYSFLNPLDVLLGDRAFCAYADERFY